MSAPETILIVGSGLAGVTAAGAVREAGFTGRIVLIGDEPELPYDRPPLSKSVLVHDNLEQLVAAHLPSDIALRSPEGIALRPRNWYSEHRIDLMLGRRVIRLDTAAHRVELDGAEAVDYDRVLLALGSSARRLPAMESGPVHHAYLRTLHDALEIRNRLQPGSKIVLLGGGVIGMEVAASAALRDCDVTVVELAPRIMARALCPPVAEHVATYHRSKGVKLKLDAHAVGQASDPEPGLKLKDGTVIAADLIVIGIGVTPNTELASAAGIKCEDGIVVDEFGATSAPDVYASGDAVRYPDEFFGRRIRSENWMHAQNQSLVVAKNLLGAREPYRQVSHMWSDQYDLKIQVAGVADSQDTVLRGTLEANKFLMFHLADGKIVGATSINEPRDIKFAQRLIEGRVPVEAEKLKDPAFNLKKAAAR
jgi:3-phenylpropionate/trans-cinnamate dioxygenase ferredoxin reductase component